MAKIQGRPSEYLKSLKDNSYWEEVKRKLRLRQNYACAMCGCKHDLDAHHITYFVDGHTIKGVELNNLKWLVLLCRTCHKAVHFDEGHIWNPSNRNKKPIT